MSDHLILGPDGAPFGTEDLAKQAAKNRQLKKGEFEIVEQPGGGFALSVPTVPDAGPAAPPVGTQEPQAGRRATPRDPVDPRNEYWVVVFQAAGNENDRPMAECTVNGINYQFGRGCETICTASQLEAVDANVKHVWTKKAGQALKQGGTVKQYPYERKRRATREEFERYLKNGNTVRDETITQLEAVAALAAN